VLSPCSEVIGVIATLGVKDDPTMRDDVEHPLLAHYAIVGDGCEDVSKKNE
jgi:hypothetical protein